MVSVAGPYCESGDIVIENLSMPKIQEGELIAIPVSGAGFSAPQIDALAEARAGAGGPVLAYCRSGMRSALLWALARAQAGDSPDAVAAALDDAGYDAGPVRAALDMLAARAGR